MTLFRLCPQFYPVLLHALPDAGYSYACLASRCLCVDHCCEPYKTDQDTRVCPRKHELDGMCTLASPGKYNGLTCTAVAMRAVTTNTVATCLAYIGFLWFIFSAVGEY